MSPVCLSMKCSISESPAFNYLVHRERSLQSQQQQNFVPLCDLQIDCLLKVEELF